MDSHLGGREGEEEPSFAGIHGGELKRLLEELADLLGLLGVDEGVDAVDHFAPCAKVFLGFRPMRQPIAMRSTPAAAKSPPKTGSGSESVPTITFRAPITTNKPMMASSHEIKIAASRMG